MAKQFNFLIKGPCSFSVGAIPLRRYRSGDVLTAGEAEAARLQSNSFPYKNYLMLVSVEETPESEDQKTSNQEVETEPQEVEPSPAEPDSSPEAEPLADVSVAKAGEGNEEVLPGLPMNSTAKTVVSYLQTKEAEGSVSLDDLEVIQATFSQYKTVQAEISRLLTDF